MKMKDLFKSPKTTWAAILALIAIIATQAVFFFDADPSTTPDYGLIITEILILFGLFNARDNNVSSEDAGAKLPEPKLTPIEIEQLKNSLEKTERF